MEEGGESSEKKTRRRPIPQFSPAVDLDFPVRVRPIFGCYLEFFNGGFGIGILGNFEAKAFIFNYLFLFYFFFLKNLKRRKE